MKKSRTFEINGNRNDKIRNQWGALSEVLFREISKLRKLYRIPVNRKMRPGTIFQARLLANAENANTEAMHP